jgi:hypothetical protein
MYCLTWSLLGGHWTEAPRLGASWWQLSRRSHLPWRHLRAKKISNCFWLKIHTRLWEKVVVWSEIFSYMLNEIYGACRHKMRFCRFLKEHANVKNTSTDEGNKPENVYKYARRSRRTKWLGRFSGIVTSSSSRFWRHPTSRCPWHLYADPSMCMIIVQRASHLVTTTHHPNRELGGSR